MSNETATAALMSPTVSSRNTVVDSTSVRMGVAPEKTRIGPNSPNDLAQANVAAVNKPLLAAGSVTYQNACHRLHPKVRATCSFLGDIWSKVDLMVLTENAHATVN